MPNYEEMTNDELRAENVRLFEERKALKAEQMKITAVLDKRIIAENVSKKLERLSDPEKAALAQVLEPPGVESPGKVGNLGDIIRKQCL